jgi:futalosine hydrolase
MLVLVPSRAELVGLWPEVAPEAAAVGPVQLAAREGPDQLPVRLAVCGVGLAVAGARAGVLLARSSDRLCVLAGLCGTYDADRLPPGGVLTADAVAQDGLGVGVGAAFRPLGAVDGPLAREPAAAAPRPLVPPALAARAVVGGLLSVAAASASEGEAADRRVRHPDCVAEDMEAHAVLLAAAEVGARLVVVRGASNVAGCRDHARWVVREALGAVRAALDAFLASA